VHYPAQGVMLSERTVVSLRFVPLWSLEVKD